MMIHVCHRLVAPATEEFCIVVDCNEVFVREAPIELVAYQTAFIYHQATLDGDIPMVRLSADVHIMDDSDGNPHCYSDLNPREQYSFNDIFTAKLDKLRQEQANMVRIANELIKSSGGR